MFESWKEKLTAKRAKEKAIAESQYWKKHPALQACLQSMRGSCTLAPMELHEAVVAVVNIALREDTWTSAEQIPGDFLPDMVYLLWDDEKIPVLQAPRDLALAHLGRITAVAPKTFLVSQSLDRIAYLDLSEEINLYSVL